jgi:phosphatidate phosphatase APP1
VLKASSGYLLLATAFCFTIFMASWKTYLTRLGYRIDRSVDKFQRFSQRFDDDALVIWPYLTYGTTSKVFIKGRVLEAQALRAASQDDSRWQNFRNALKRFRSDEVANATVRVNFQNQTRDLETDEEGFFETWLGASSPLASRHDKNFYSFTVELLAPLRKEQTETLFQGQIMVPQNPAFGIISDVDDTILQSDATRVFRMARKVLFGNARTRLPFEGVAAFYQRLHANKNPLFYVSSSPWNLYDLLVEFLEINDIPLGPLMLRDWGISDKELLPTGHAGHKLHTIKQILDTYPALPFILIGDSGQEDPEIYSEVVAQYPGRILAIYIRDVSSGSRTEAINTLAQNVLAAKSELLLVPDTTVAEEHARSRGWIV